MHEPDSGVGLRARGLALALALAASGGACINGSPASATHVLGQPAVTAVTITGVAGTANPGQSAQLTANVAYSDGTSVAVTSLATWQSANTAVATVSSSGMVRFVSIGESDIRATYQSVSGTTKVTVTAAPVLRSTLSGVLTDADSHRAIATARVDVVDGADAGRNTTTAADGSFALTDLAEGTFNIRITHKDYNELIRAVTLSGPTRVDVTVRPLVNVSGLYGTFSVRLSVSRQTCEEPVVPGTSGQLTLSGNSDGTNLRASIVERGQTRVYGGTMRTDGSFSAGGAGVIGLVPPPGNSIIRGHDFTGSISGRVVGSTVSGTEAVTYGAPCPGKILEIAFSGSK